MTAAINSEPEIVSEIVEREPQKVDHTFFFLIEEMKLLENINLPEVCIHIRRVFKAKGSQKKWV